MTGNPVHIEAAHLCEAVAGILRPILPRGFRGKLTINVVDTEPLSGHHISVEFRPPQPKGSHLK